MVNNLKLLIKSNKKTFVSILLLTMLGVGFLVGMKSSVPYLKYSVDAYFDEYNLYDLELSSSIGFNKEDINEFSKIEKIDKIIGSYKKDFLVNGKNDNYVLRVHSYINEEKGINQLELIKGRLPINNDEIVIEDKLYKKQEYKLDDVITLDNDLLKNKQLKIVGVIKSPLYLSSNKGSTNLLSGKVNYYAYVNFNNIESDLYSNIYITLKDKNDINEVIKNIKKAGSDILDVRYTDTINEYNKKIAEGQKELDNKKKDAENKIAKYEKEIENAELQILSAEKSIPTLKEAEVILSNKKNELKKVKKELDNAKIQIDNARIAYNNNKKELDNASSELKKLRKNISELKQNATVENDKLRQENSKLRQELSTASESRKVEINNQINENNQIIKYNEDAYNFALDYIDLYQYNLNTYRDLLNESKVELDARQYEYDLTYSEYQKVLKTAEAKSASEIIELAKKEVASKKKILSQKKEELENNKQKVRDEFNNYQNELNDAKDYLKLVSISSWGINKREDMTSYSQYLSDIKRIESISNFFPIIFYIVAVLITLTNITRIIENDRDKIGLYKALGYSNVDIGNDYIYFSALSCIIGSILGVFIGLFLIPRIFYSVYSIIYYLPKFRYVIDYILIIVAVLVAIVLVITSTFMSIKSTIKEWPAILFRPKQNNKGKRVFLEKIPFIWNHLNFTNKVTFRNMFKYPKRFIMTILGISGCISLIIAGFNIRTSISNIIPLQFGKIFDVDVEIFFKDSLSRNDIQKEKERISNIEEIDSTILSYVKYVYLNDDKIKANLVVPEDNDLLLDFVSLENNGKNYELNNDSAIITKKMSQLMKISIGENVKIRDSENNVFSIKIGAIVDNYVDNYIYISKEYYNNLLNSLPKYNAILVRMNNDNYNEEQLSSKFNEEEKISYLIYTSTSETMYNTLTKSLNYIVYVLVVSAIILAFIVLYNLNSLNVEERKREIATIKVLGFYKKETYKYIENETKRLTFVGIVIGIVLGYIFSNILIKSCELDNLMYDYSINYLNYCYAIVLTIVFMVITSMLGRKNIKKIDMIESLKKVE